MRFLLDEMFAKAAAAVLRDEFDHDALHVGEAGLSGADDVAVATFGRSKHRTVVTENVSDYAREPDLVLVCGGGSRNPVLMTRLQSQLPEVAVQTTDSVGVSASAKEAIAFAVLGYWQRQGFPGNLPAVTGASRSTPLGHLSLPPACP